MKTCLLLIFEIFATVGCWFLFLSGVWKIIELILAF
jgi:hypothetical protein